MTSFDAVLFDFGGVFTPSPSAAPPRDTLLDRGTRKASVPCRQRGSAARYPAKTEEGEPGLRPGSPD